MSAWYIFAALGFYPLNPASGEYLVGSPLYGRIDLHLANGHRFSVIATNQAPANAYIQSATLNGEPLVVPVIEWKDIQHGGFLQFTMGPQPSTWASDWKPAAIPAN
jgi:putative alpha-1,2-mannosidase